MIACLNKYWCVWTHASAIACHSLTGLVLPGFNCSICNARKEHMYRLYHMYLGFNQFLLIKPGTQILIHHLDRENKYANSHAAAHNSCIIDLARAICIIKLHSLYRFQSQFHDNKRVTNSPLRVTEHRSPDWKPVVVTTIPLVFASLLILLCADTQLEVLKRF